MLEVKNLKINYGGIEAVRNVSFTVPNAKIVTLVGAMEPANPLSYAPLSD